MAPEGASGGTAAEAAEASVPLPPGRPGKLAGPEEEEAEQRGPPVSSPSEMRRLALEEARRVLPQELALMIPMARGAIEELTAHLRANQPPDEAEATAAEAPADLPAAEAAATLFGPALAGLAWEPLAGCRPALRGAPEEDVRAKLQLFWRCSVALCMMPLPHLAALSQRKRQFLEDLDAHLPCDGDSPAAARLKHMRLNLPIFAMVARLPEADRPKQQQQQQPQTLAAPPAATHDQEGAPRLPEQQGQAAAAAATELAGAAEEEGQAAGAPAVDEDSGDDLATKRSPVGTEAGPPNSLLPDMARSAARHTYDVGYGRWEKFDVEAALREADGDGGGRANAQRKQAVNLSEVAKPNPALACEDPVEALDKAIADLKETQDKPTANDAASDSKAKSEEETKEATDGEIENTADADADAAPKKSAAPKTGLSLADRYKRWDKFDADVALEEASDAAQAAPRQPSSRQTAAAAAAGREQPAATEATAAGADAEKSSIAARTAEAAPPPAEIAVAGANDEALGTTASALSQEYRKWDALEQDDLELDDVDEDYDDVNAAAELDLDAIKGPQDEVAKIRKHWRREFKQRTAAARREQRREQTAAEARRPQGSAEEPLPQGPVISRPCEYRPPSDPSAAAAQAINRDYSKWKNFDADSALLELENEGTTEEGTSLRCSASKGSAMLNCENYTRDREEYELDEEITQQVGGLKKHLAQRLKDASNLKIEGNRLLRAGQVQDASRAYAKGLEAMELCQQAAVLMSDSLSDKQGRLIADLHRNLAAAQLELGQFEEARASCDAALAASKEADGSQGSQGEEDEKALYRRALALLGLGRAADARADVERLAGLRGEGDAAVKRLRARAAEGGR